MVAHTHPDDVERPVVTTVVVGLGVLLVASDAGAALKDSPLEVDVDVIACPLPEEGVAGELLAVAAGVLVAALGAIPVTSGARLPADGTTSPATTLPALPGEGVGE